MKGHFCRLVYQLVLYKMFRL
uniref:Uncharacterized protein n=1 Tax=Tetranychus urticae TaxID=32264 RepID=T1K8L2_TETUR